MRVRPRPNGKFITAKDAAKEYGLTYGRILTWITEGKLRRLDERVAGRTYILLRADVEKFIEESLTTGSL